MQGTGTLPNTPPFTFFGHINLMFSVTEIAHFSVSRAWVPLVGGMHTEHNQLCVTWDLKCSVYRARDKFLFAFPELIQQFASPRTLSVGIFIQV